MTNINKIIFTAILVILTIIFMASSGIITKAVSSWQEADVNGDGKVNSLDIVEVLKFWGCPLAGTCGGPTPDGEKSSIGLSFLYSQDTLQFMPYLTNEKDYVDMKGANISSIQEIREASIKVDCVSISLDEMRDTVTKLQDNGVMCDYLAYNAENRPEATPPEELDNYVISVQTAQQIAHNAGAVFVNGPGLKFMEEQDDRGRQMYKDTAPYVDIWMIQSQGYTTKPNSDEHVTPEQYGNAVSEVVGWIHEGNPEARIWVQVILSGGRLATNPLTAEEVVSYARAVEDIVDNMRIYLRDQEGVPLENLEKLRQIIEQLRSQE